MYRFNEREKLKPRAPPFHVLWHGSPGQITTKGANSNSSIVTAPSVANMESLRSRWELSSATGTPLHPDVTEEELLRAARNLSEMNLPRKTIGGTLKKTASLRAVAPLQYASLYKPLTGHSTSFYSNEDFKENSMTYADLYHTSKYTQVDMIEEEDYDEHELSEKEYITKEGYKRVESSKNDDSKSDFASAYQKSSFSAYSYHPSPSTESLAPSTVQIDQISELSEPSIADRSAPERSILTLDPAHPNEETSTSDNDPTLPYSLSFYRKSLRTAKKSNNLETLVYTGEQEPQTPKAEVEVKRVESRKEQNDLDKLTKKLNKAIAIEDARITQASRALVYCRQSGKFSGTLQEVDALRTLLVAEETWKKLHDELDNLTKKTRDPELARGVIQISSIKLPLALDFLRGQIRHSEEVDLVYYFIILIKCDSTLLHTQLISTEKGIQADGSVEFDQFMQIENVSPDFNCHFDVYALRSSRAKTVPEQTRERKGSMKRLSSVFSFKSTKPPKTTSRCILDQKFNLVGSLDLNLETFTGTKFHLLEPQHPLHGEMHMRIKKFVHCKTS